ncbi:MAG: tetratricopeptide repeat protein [Candidatus Gastranaerophilaceae bacterium]|nr:tetratricopeptide repeat protein [Candidatus Gastranaerophilaceae bacterium]
MNEFDYLAKAKKNMEKEKYHEVISFCDKALKINNDLPEAYSFKGNALYNLGEYNDAAESFSHAIEKEPDEAEHYYDRSWSYCNMDKYEDSIIDINKALEIEPKASAFYYDRGRFEYWAERYKDAVISFTKGIELKPTENKYLFRGNCYMALEEFDLALADFNSSIEIDPEFARAYYRRGILYKKMELLENAARDFKKAIELDPKCDDAMTELGFIHIQMGKKDAMKYFNKAIKINPCAGNYFSRVAARAEMLKRQNAIENFASGKVTKDDCYADCTFNEKQAKDDIKDLDKAIAFEPDDTYYYSLRISRYKYLKQYENALADYEKLIELEPDEEEFYLEMAYCKYNTDKFAEAIEGIDAYLKMINGSGDDFLYQTRGNANYELGNFEEALKDLSKSLVLNETADSYYYRGLVNFRLQHFIQAYKDFASALELNSKIESETDYDIPKLIKVFLNKKQHNDTPIGLCQMKIKE